VGNPVDTLNVPLTHVRLHGMKRQRIDRKQELCVVFGDSMTFKGVFLLLHLWWRIKELECHASVYWCECVTLYIWSKYVCVRVCVNYMVSKSCKINVYCKHVNTEINREDFNKPIPVVSGNARIHRVWCASEDMRFCSGFPICVKQLRVLWIRKY